MKYAILGTNHEAKKVLGMEIEWVRKSGKVLLTQKGYLKKVLQKFNI